MKFNPGLYLVATPIGNLDDITYRAVEVLNKSAFVLAEDTRTSKKLLSHYDINTQLISYRDQNHAQIIDKAYEKVDMGLSLALITDAGTPAISDPGFLIVRDFKANGYDVYTIPGADAVTSAVSISGLPTDSYLFLGFLSKSKKKRMDVFTEYSELPATVVIYESPYRLLSTLEIIAEVLGGDRYVSVAKNLTKLTEEVTTAPVSEVLEYYNLQSSIKGEFVVSIGKAGFAF